MISSAVRMLGIYTCWYTCINTYTLGGDLTTIPLSYWSPHPLSIKKKQSGSQINDTNLLFWPINGLHFGAWVPLHHVWLLLWFWSMLGQKVTCQLHCHLLCILPPRLPPIEVLTSLLPPFLFSRYFKSSSSVSFLSHSHHPAATIFGCGHLCLWFSTFCISCLLFTYLPVPLVAPNCTLVRNIDCPKTDFLHM